MIKKLALHSYTIVKIGAAATLLIIALIKYILKVQMSLPFVAVFFSIAGIYVGYTIAYYSIKYLREEEIKKQLPLN